MKVISDAFQRTMGHYVTHILNPYSYRVYMDSESSEIMIGGTFKLTMGKGMELQESTYDSLTTQEEGRFLRITLTNNYLSRRTPAYIDAVYEREWDLSVYKTLAYNVYAPPVYHPMYVLYDERGEIKQVILALGTDGTYAITTSVIAKISNSSILDTLSVIAEPAEIVSIRDPESGG